LIAHFGEKPLVEIDQGAIDAAAIELFPNHTNATRNREVYSPLSAILKHAGIDFKLRRPKGSRGRELIGWLWPEEADRLLTAALKIDVEFGLLCMFLLYTGLRLSEGTLRFTCDRLRLTEGYAFIPETKNGEPRPIHLPPHVIAALGKSPTRLRAWVRACIPPSPRRPSIQAALSSRGCCQGHAARARSLPFIPAYLRRMDAPLRRQRYQGACCNRRVEIRAVSLALCPCGRK